MKIFSSIMALIVLLLSAERTLATFEQKQALECCSSCHDIDDNASDEEHDKNPCNDKCNPFQPCNFCTGYTIDCKVVSILNPHISKARKFVFEPSSYFHFFPDFWQPPRMA